MMELLRRLVASRYLISTQLYAGLGAAVAITLGASLVAWLSFDRVDDARDLVSDDILPEIVASFGIVQKAGVLVAAGPRFIAAANPDELAATAASVRADQQAFEALLGANEVDGAGSDIRELGKTLTENIDAIAASMRELFEIDERSQQARADIAVVQLELARILVPAIDDQLFYALTGYRTLGEGRASRAQHLSETEIVQYRRLAELHGDATIANQLLASAFNLSDEHLLAPLRDRFLSTMGSFERNLVALGETPLRATIEPHFTQLRALGIGAEGAFELHGAELALGRQQQDLLASNREIASQLVAKAEGRLGQARERATTAIEASKQTVLTSRTVLLVLNVLSIVGAVLIAWLFIGRILLRRIERLSQRMRSMADGELEAEVDIGGRDEVADMAKALEVFRRHALEVQRLNLVEKLADELRGKNDQLESALTELRQAQDQIVSREKLAALGELTAGVAHEIKNPLNFVKNFAEASEELLEELNEVLEEAKDSLTEEQREITDEVRQDLVENLGRIRQHGDRADRIVRDMLAMGRDASDMAPTDINALLDQHARLAFHSARGADPDFQLTIDQDFDPNMGEVSVVAQDMGRVFLNMFTNACYATNERRASAGSGYTPTLSITSKRFDDRIEVAVRDNGSGIPPEVVDKIFNPFFTTKPTDQGTGLGLALSNDIVRQHGGEIRVDSKPDEYTEMTVVIPVADGAAKTAAT